MNEKELMTIKIGRIISDYNLTYNADLKVNNCELWNDSKIYYNNNNRVRLIVLYNNDEIVNFLLSNPDNE